jgi:hypothetical protein
MITMGVPGVSDRNNGQGTKKGDAFFSAVSEFERAGLAASSSRNMATRSEPESFRSE